MALCPNGTDQTFAHARCQDAGKVMSVIGDHSVHMLSQWATALQCNTSSHWLGAHTKWSLCKNFIYSHYVIPVSFLSSARGALSIWRCLIDMTILIIDIRRSHDCLDFAWYEIYSVNNSCFATHKWPVRRTMWWRHQDDETRESANLLSIYMYIWSVYSSTIEVNMWYTECTMTNPDDLCSVI